MRNAIVMRASFAGAYVVAADLCYANFLNCDFSSTKLRLSKIGSVKFLQCNFFGADLAYCTAEKTKFTGSKLLSVDMQHMQLVAADLTDVELRDAKVYGISAWDLRLNNCCQSGLVVTHPEASSVTVADLDLAQFIYLLLNNQRLRDVINTITSKVVLILGRFSDERKPVLDALRDELSNHDLVPILFDFDKPHSRNFLETASTLAHMASFIVADFTDQGRANVQGKRI
ncbi:hypothetical protein GMJAKD_04060 [Candidatus Electrothrix aarhusensis]